MQNINQARFNTFRFLSLKSYVGNIVKVPVVNVKNNEDLAGYGYLVEDLNDFTAESGTFEIVKWPVSGWRQLDPDTGDEAGTTEGNFEVR